MSKLRDKLLGNTTLKRTSMLDDSTFFTDIDLVPTSVPMMNVALSGKLDGGLTPGITMFAGPSKHFKTAFCLLLAAAYLKHHKDSLLLFYDSEFGTPQSYFENFDIDLSRVVHTPITNVEELKHDIMSQLAGIENGDKVIIVIDSIGNLASKKEVDDALEGKSVADMTRAKQLKSLGRMVTPHLRLKNIPLLMVNHTYKEIALFPKDIVGGGTGTYYSSDAIFIVGRRQEKTGDELMGYNFILNVEKSRYVQEKTKIPITVKFDGGISTWSGLLDIALESAHVIKPSNGWYQRAGEPAKYRLKDTDTREFWLPILQDATFQQYIKDNYALAHSSFMNNELSDEDIAGEYADA